VVRPDRESESYSFSQKHLIITDTRFLSCAPLV
jgi:hypothetical protein